MWQVQAQVPRRNTAGGQKDVACRPRIGSLGLVLWILLWAHIVLPKIRELLIGPFNGVTETEIVDVSSAAMKLREQKLPMSWRWVFLASESEDSKVGVGCGEEFESML